MLSWFVEKAVIQAAITGGLIEEESVECRPEVSNAVLDEKGYFSREAWMMIQDVFRCKREFPSWDMFCVPA